MGLSHADSDENANQQLVISPTKRIHSPRTSPNLKISNNQNIFSILNRYNSKQLKASILHRWNSHEKLRQTA